MKEHRTQEKEIRLWLLGTGTPEITLNRACSSYILKVKDSYILFDHGFGSYHRLLELDIPLSKITHVFITHHHYDHIGDLARLILTRWDQGAGEIPELKIFGPQPIKKIIESLISENGAFGLDLQSRVKSNSSLYVYHSRGGQGERERPQPLITELKKGDKVKEDLWEIEVTEGIHQQPYLIPLAYKLKYNNQIFVYSGDTSYSKNIELLAKYSDVLVHMCHYISGDESFEIQDDVMGHMELATLAQNAKVKNLVLTHMSEKKFDKPGIREKVILDISRTFKGKIFFGEDLMEIPFD